MPNELREWLARLWASLNRGRRETDIQEELRLHLELAAEKGQQHSESIEDARREARLRLGSVTQAMDAVRDQHRLRWLDDATQDLRYGLRTIRRSPLFAAVIVLSLALGIGANAALISLVDATLLRELPVETPRELIQFRWESRGWFPDMQRFAGSGSLTLSRGLRSAPPGGDSCGSCSPKA